jgi:hypothetical protein
MAELARFEVLTLRPAFVVIHCPGEQQSLDTLIRVGQAPGRVLPAHTLRALTYGC